MFSRRKHQKCSRLADDDLQAKKTKTKTKKNSKPRHTRLKFDLEKLKDPNVLETFQARIGGRFAPLTIISNEDTDIDSVSTTFNKALIETTSEILGKHRQLLALSLYVFL